MNQVLLVQVDPNISATLRTSSTLAGQVAQEEFETTEKAVDFLMAASRDFEVIVIGGETRNPVQTAQKIHALDPNAVVILLSSQSRIAALKKAVSFAPFLGSDTECFSLEQCAELDKFLASKAAQARSRRNFKGAIASMNSRQFLPTSPSATTPPNSGYFEQLLESAPIGILTATTRGELLSWNRSACEILDLKEESALGQSLELNFPPLEATRLREELAKVSFGGHERSVEVERASIRGTRQFLELTFSPVKGRNSAQGLLVLVTDTTERKMGELRLLNEKQRFEAIFNGSAWPLVFFRGPDLVYEIFNSKYQDLVPGRDLLGRPLLEVLPELAGTSFPALIKQVYDSGEPALTSEEYVPLLDAGTGEVVDRYFDSAISPINDGDGHRSGVFVQVTETTERVLSRKKIEQALVSRDTFLSIASHELRTPITGMKLQAQMLQRALRRAEGAPIDNNRVARFVSQTNDGLSRMNILVEDMLDITRIQAGKLILHCEPTEMISFVREVTAKFADQLTLAGIVSTITPSKQEIWVAADRFRIEQVITNLVTNAIRYAPNAPVEIFLGETDGYFQMAFHDHGPGIPKDGAEKIFERFARLVSANEVSGMGLGLFIVRQIVVAHGGKIYVEDGNHSGARFVMLLPKESYTPLL